MAEDKWTEVENRRNCWRNVSHCYKVIINPFNGSYVALLKAGSDFKVTPTPCPLLDIIERDFSILQLGLELLPRSIIHASIYVVVVLLISLLRLKQNSRFKVFLSSIFVLRTILNSHLYILSFSPSPPPPSHSLSLTLSHSIYSSV